MRFQSPVVHFCCEDLKGAGERAHDLHQPGLAQHFQMLADRRLQDGKPRRDLGHGCRPSRDPLEHASSGGVGKGGEDVG
jgi:hypothetical protein